MKLFRVIVRTQSGYSDFIEFAASPKVVQEKYDNVVAVEKVVAFKSDSERDTAFKQARLEKDDLTMMEMVSVISKIIKKSKNGGNE